MQVNQNNYVQVIQKDYFIFCLLLTDHILLTRNVTHNQVKNRKYFATFEQVKTTVF